MNNLYKYEPFLYHPQYNKSENAILKHCFNMAKLISANENDPQNEIAAKSFISLINDISEQEVVLASSYMGFCIHTNSKELNISETKLLINFCSNFPSNSTSIDKHDLFIKSLHASVSKTQTILDIELSTHVYTPNKQNTCKIS